MAGNIQIVDYMKVVGFGLSFEVRLTLLKTNFMKTKTTVTTIFFAFLSITVIGQESNDIEKKKTIENNPSNYINQGGVLPDKREPKESQEKKPEFVIHKSTSETGVERKFTCGCCCCGW